MGEIFSYTPYHSRRNTFTKNEETLDLLSKYCCDNPIEYLHQHLGKVNLEIGFGSGEFIFQEAVKNPDVLYLGCEVYNPGIVKLARNLKKNDVKNVIIYKGDARDVLTQTPHFFFKNIYILFPDPWPKKKHHKRRLINPQFLNFIAEKFCCNLNVATDHDGYAESILHDVLQNSHYEIQNLEITKEKFFSTKFESKAISMSGKVFNLIASHKS